MHEKFRENRDNVDRVLKNCRIMVNISRTPLLVNDRFGKHLILVFSIFSNDPSYERALSCNNKNFTTLILDKTHLLDLCTCPDDVRNDRGHVE